MGVPNTVDSHIRHTPPDTVRGMPYKGVCPVRVTPKIDHKKSLKIAKNHKKILRVVSGQCSSKEVMDFLSAS